jgi:hypothetical protein
LRPRSVTRGIFEKKDFRWHEPHELAVGPRQLVELKEGSPRLLQGRDGDPIPRDGEGQGPVEVGAVTHTQDFSVDVVEGVQRMKDGVGGRLGQHRVADDDVVGGDTQDFRRDIGGLPGPHIGARDDAGH